MNSFFSITRTFLAFHVYLENALMTAIHNFCKRNSISMNSFGVSAGYGKLTTFLTLGRKRKLVNIYKKKYVYIFFCSLTFLRYDNKKENKSIIKLKKINDF